MTPEDRAARFLEGRPGEIDFTELLRDVPSEEWPEFRSRVTAGLLHGRRGGRRRPCVSDAGLYLKQRLFWAEDRRRLLDEGVGKG